MMTEREKDKVFLSHILESICYIEEYIAGFDRKLFNKIVSTQDSVIRRFEIIGEAFNKISNDFRKKHPEINWRQAIDMRNIMIHDYFEVDLDIVWDTARDDLPPLKSQIEKILKDL